MSANYTDCLRRISDCREGARRTPNLRDKTQWRRLAKTWIMLARVNATPPISSQDVSAPLAKRQSA
jgi:hypothetical protein